MSENEKCHLAHEECHSALWKCQMALGHTMMLTPWWADSYAFPMHVLHFLVFWKIFSSFVIMKHSPTQLQTLWNLFQTWLRADVAYINEFSCNKSLSHPWLAIKNFLIQQFMISTDGFVALISILGLSLQTTN